MFCLVLVSTFLGPVTFSLVLVVFSLCSSIDCRGTAPVGHRFFSFAHLLSVISTSFASFARSMAWNVIRLRTPVLIPDDHDHDTRYESKYQWLIPQWNYSAVVTRVLNLIMPTHWVGSTVLYLLHRYAMIHSTVNTTIGYSNSELQTVLLKLDDIDILVSRLRSGYEARRQIARSNATEVWFWSSQFYRKYTQPSTAPTTRDWPSQLRPSWK